MVLFSAFFLPAIFILLSHVSAIQAYFTQYCPTETIPTCKCLPQDACWPSPRAWHRLNTTLHGALIKTVLPASVCYNGSNYNAKACEVVTEDWTSSSFHAADPASIDYPGFAGDSCLPTANPNNGTCTIGGYPVYVINVTTVEHVQAGVAFAKTHNVRLVVKGTGHDFLGKSTGTGALSIWTHNMRKLELHDDFLPENHPKHLVAEPALTIGAGHQMFDIYEAIHERGLVIVGGAGKTVGIGGYILGGGHSPISSHYGMACDQVLEYELVTPMGEYLIVNQYQNKDLFWALRGGGGSTFGVLISVTVKTFPSPTMQVSIWNFNLTTTNTSAFIDAVAYVHSQLPELNDGGLMGYYYVYKLTSVLAFVTIFHTVNRNATYVDNLMKSVDANLTSKPYSNDLVYKRMPTIELPSFYEYFTYVLGEETVGSSPLLPSRLLPKRALVGEPRAVLAEKLTEAFYGGFIGHMVAGPGVAQFKDVDMALNPAWRETYVHLISGYAFPDGEPAKQEAFDYASGTLEYALRQLAPDSGAYLNEAIPNEVNFQQSFFGTNYPRLYAIKQRYDPDGVFYCITCVGSEDWTETEDGRLCKVSWA